MGGWIALCLLTQPVLAQAPEENSELVAATSEASSSSAPSEPLLYPSRDMRNKSLFADATKDEAQWLDTEYGKILALYRPTEAKKTLGVLVLFHAAEDPQFWPAALESLRANLPRYGWETLAISLPHQYPAAIPNRPSSSSSSAPAPSTESDTSGEITNEQPPATEQESSSSTSSSAASSSSVAREVLISAYVTSAFNFLNENQRFNVVVLTDNSSAHQVLQSLIPQIKENPEDPTTIDGPLQALVITNLQQQEPLNKEELSSIFAAKELPILDIFFTPEDAEQKTSRELHRAVAMRNKVADYQQLLIDNPPRSVTQDYQGYLLGRVRGFMKQKASGDEFTNKDEKTENQQ